MSLTERQKADPFRTSTQLGGLIGLTLGGVFGLSIFLIDGSFVLAAIFGTLALVGTVLWGWLFNFKLYFKDSDFE